MFLKLLDRFEETFVMVLIGAATSIIFVAVVHRYLASAPIPGLQDWLLTVNLGWAQELCIILFVWMAKFGAAYGVRTGIHVGVDVFINSLQAKARAKFVVFGLLAGAVFTGIIGTLGAHFVWENGLAYSFLSTLGDPGDYFEGPTTPDLEVPTWIVYSAIPLGSYLMCFRFLQVMVSFVRTGELPVHEHGHVDGMEEDGKLPVDANVYNLDDDVHPADVAHHPDQEKRR